MQLTFFTSREFGGDYNAIPKVRLADCALVTSVAIDRKGARQLHSAAITSLRKGKQKV